MIEVFKTNVQEVNESVILVQQLLEHFPKGRISFDLEDCDRILRVDELHLCPERIIQVLAARGYHCEVLP